ncbi:molybdenum cofactor biosynthesis protein MoaE [Pseudoruegeria sp. SK021]|uniref:molybdenum cofactor biosynthesis protein MoaE n=1 Tax=Pseudoruegeria sp. SK021 TaxID=1933035 RepID=UPI000A24BC86|nr:molybdenum cofactor biosynthesis protein MoaE [Pseudoruegeria sp. SK021]OSP55716.1 molybdenum cofactor biosynthesis protein MoaE [Pseudoruegeria sp. SK021]
MDVRVQSSPFDPGIELNRFTDHLGGAEAGAIVTFSGVVRNRPDGSLVRMEIEHYPGMTELALAEIGQEAMSRWSLLDALVIHRFGPLVPGEPIMMVATAAAHRSAAFEAAEFLMDYLKSRAPFWKKEVTSDTQGWVAARSEDEQALTRWR